uniref:Uncharacterized protein n=1 Tax=Physcomitrium patens TaxID=3218 RepID=A0A2K1KH97_PHYPA|nr:hypothetical protein PHYPA_009536 [Physcomitrium patens]
MILNILCISLIQFCIFLFLFRLLHNVKVVASLMFCTLLSFECGYRVLDRDCQPLDRDNRF